MDKRIIFSVAGSGKTSLIINSLDIENRSIIITYTNNNLINLREKIIDKFDFFPENIRLYSYFTFLYSFCYKPFLSWKIRAKGLNWDFPPKWTMRLQRSDIKYFLDASKRLYHNRLAKLLDQEGILLDLNHRLEKYFDNIFIDEVQDFAGHDFNLLSSICQSDLKIILVGDYFQHTFDTSRDGAVNKNLHVDYEKYINRFKKMGVTVDFNTLSNSYRCSPTVCDFISDKLGIEISSHRSDKTSVGLVEDQTTIEEKFNCGNTVKLFYEEHHKYPCYSQNWGASKGQDKYEDVCLVLNGTSYRLLKADKLHELNPKTKNKLYVACTRARNDLYLVPDKSLKAYKQQ